MHWGQAHVWREIARYDMRKELEISQDYSHGVNSFTLFNAPGEKTNITHQREVSVECDVGQEDGLTCQRT